MKVAVVCETVEEATLLAARLGMTRTALPLAAESSALLGYRFTAVVVRSMRSSDRRDLEWWEMLFTRNTGPVYLLSALAMAQDAVPHE